MSYEGREIYLCSGGHLLSRDCYQSGKPPKICQFCGGEYQFVGSVDDTNGDAVSCFKLECIEQEQRDVSYENGTMKMTLKPARYSVFKSAETWYNFDTGEEHC